METTWFLIVGMMFLGYVILDGFDFGAGIVHLLVARTDRERRTVLAAIGPLWDGNEVWLLAGGGILFYAFPRAYAAGFSGFYMPLMIVLWLLVLRGLAIEFRSKEENPLWRSFWDGTFAFASCLMAIVLGAALGNVVRGVSLDQTGYFTTPLFTNFAPGVSPGVLDWFTVSIGLLAFVTLAGHGTLYLVWKTTGDVHERARRLAPKVWGGVAVLGALATAATAVARPDYFPAVFAKPLAWPLVALALGGLVGVFALNARGKELPAFLASCVFITGLLGATAVGIFPVILRSTVDRAYDLTVLNARAGDLNLRVGLVWWVLAIVLAIGYFVYLFRSFRGKVQVTEEGHGY